ncbi:MAG: sporulation protein YunB [Clostridia bacterium]|nr:sporulation protein YunB [Clostridia bacterium]
MDSIYRRKQIRLPKIMFQKFGKMEPKKRKKICKFFVIILIMFITFYSIFCSIGPILDALCKDKAKAVATIICNEESTKIISNYQYEDLITIHRDNDNNITMIQSNITPINYIISDVGEKIQKRIDETKSEKIHINLGSFTGSKILSGIGPNIPIKLSLIGNVETDLRSEFKAQGINQTIHRIYLQVDCKVSILTPYNITQENISNQVLIAENIIVGKIPEAYYNLQGLSKENAIDVVQ